MKTPIKNILFAAVLLMAAVFGTGKTYSFLSDSESAVNPVTPGSNETVIIEEFPDPPPQAPKDDPVYDKTVQISAPQIGGSNVDCYIRARVIYSNSDIGNAAVLEGIGAGWVQGADEYYYYTGIISEGQTTVPLFTKVRLDSSKIPENVSKYVEDFRISIYEESVQAGGCSDYKEAWSRFVPAEV